MLGKFDIIDTDCQDSGSLPPCDATLGPLGHLEQNAVAGAFADTGFLVDILLLREFETSGFAELRCLSLRTLIAGSAGTTVKIVSTSTFDLLHSAFPAKSAG
jgi:hypothetical protein